MHNAIVFKIPPVWKVASNHQAVHSMSFPNIPLQMINAGIT